MSPKKPSSRPSRGRSRVVAGLAAPLAPADPDEARRARAKERRRRQLVSRSLFGAGVVVVLQHLGFHLVGSPNALADVLVGYPTGAALIVAGAIVLGP